MPRADRIEAKGIELLLEDQVGVLSTVLPDGSPHATPVWVDVEPDGSHILINTSMGHQKFKNVERNPHVAVTVVDRNDNWRTVQVRGIVVETLGPDKGSLEHINKLSKKYTGRENYVVPEGETRVIMRIKPTHILQWSGARKGGTGWRTLQGDTAQRPS
jgi:PPOX class probable F420-dependent enzyme